MSSSAGRPDWRHANSPNPTHFQRKPASRCTAALKVNGDCFTATGGESGNSTKFVTARRDNTLSMVARLPISKKTVRGECRTHLTTLFTPNQFLINHLH